MKGKVSINVEKDNYDFLVKSGVNVSALADAAYTQEAQRIRAEQWKAESKASMSEYSAYIEKHGSFADANRNW